MPMRFGVLTHALCALVFLTCAAPASAAPERASLNWVRGPEADECVTPQALAAQVEDWLGPVFVAPADADLAVEGAALHAEDGFEARITISRRDGVQVGERKLHVQGTSCAPMAVQAAFVIAVTLDPEMTLSALPAELAGLLATTEEPGELLRAELERQAAPPARDPFVQAEEPTVIAEPSAAPRPVPTAPAQPTRHRLRAGLGISAGALPRPAAVLHLSYGWTRRYLGLELTLAGILPARIAQRWQSSGRAHSFWAGSLRGRFGLCSRPLGTRVWVAGCASVSASRYVAPAVVSPGERDPLSVLNYGGYLLLGVPLGRGFSVGAELELERNLRPAYFRATPSGEHGLDLGSERAVRFLGLVALSRHF